jgi:urate oxidase
LTFVLAQNSYGKSDIRLVKVTRGADRHELCDVTVDVALEGDFAAAHATGDNAGLLATDTMRNTVYALAASNPVDDLELFGRVLVEHFVAAAPSVGHARVRLVEHPWTRLGDHDHAFMRAGGGERVAVVSGDGESARFEAGIEDLVLLRTTGSGFEGFLREQYTTLPETTDRILATAVSARWSYAEGGIDYGAAWTAARGAILQSFADHDSPSVQFTLQRIGEAVLSAVDAIERVHLSLPNRHHLLYDLGRFGIENDNVVFHASAEPHGLIEGTVERQQPGPRAV